MPQLHKDIAVFEERVLELQVELERVRNRTPIQNTEYFGTPKEIDLAKFEQILFERVIDDMTPMLERHAIRALKEICKPDPRFNRAPMSASVHESMDGALAVDIRFPEMHNRIMIHRGMF